MMKTYKYITALILTLALFACSNDVSLLSEDGEQVSMTFHPQLAGDLHTRAFGDVLNIDRLRVFVYEGQERLSKIFTYTEDWETAQQYGIILNLVKGRSYRLLFWAEVEGNEVYHITQDGKVSVDYTDAYTQGGFDMMEKMDAFYGTSSIIVGPHVSGVRSVSLTRPFAQLNFMDNAVPPVAGTHKATVTFHDIPVQFNPFTGKVTERSSNDITFEFADFTTETMEVNGSPCYYVASNYLFAPKASTTTVTATIHLQQKNGSSVSARSIEFKDEKAIILERNKKTNVVGSLMP